MKTNKLGGAVMALLLSAAISLFSCSDDEDPIVITDPVWVTDAENLKDIAGFYVLNQGNFGNNNCTFDRFVYRSGAYENNVFLHANPSAVMGLGDTGNDVHVFDGKLYVAVNGSNLVTVADVYTARKIADIDVPNCRYFANDGRYVYVSSYVGQAGADPTDRHGVVMRIDPRTFTVTGTCEVGYQPEQMAVAEGKLYVANSGGYRAMYGGDYDNTVSVIDLSTFTLKCTIEVAVNLFGMQYDSRRNQIFVSSQGNYMDIPSTISIIDPVTDRVKGVIDEACTNMAVCGNSLYMYCTEWNYVTNSYTNTFAVYDIDRNEIVSDKFITDGTDSEIQCPYGISINPENGDIVISDARDYVSPGRVYCYNSQGVGRWMAVTGVIPSAIAFIPGK